LEEKGFSKLNQAACSFFCVEDEEDLFGIFPYASELNKDDQSAKALADIVEEVKCSAKAVTIAWVHQTGEQDLHCQATYVPIYKDHSFDSILCIWSDQSAAHIADAAIADAMASMHFAVEKRQSTERLLAVTEEQLANNQRQLTDTSSAMQSVQEDLEHTKAEFVQLQTDYQQSLEQMQELKQDLDIKHAELNEAHDRSADLSIEIDTAKHTIEILQSERDDIYTALSQSKAEYETAQLALQASSSDVQNLAETKEEQAETLNALLNKVDSMQDALRIKD
jgi:epidermal growth factor receptor substrate 15